MLYRFKSAGRLAFSASQVVASGQQNQHATIASLTHSITFTPVVVASHRRPVMMPVVKSTMKSASTPGADLWRCWTVARRNPVARITVTRLRGKKAD